MQQRSPAVNESNEPVQPEDGTLDAGQTRETKPAGQAIVWFFVVASVLAIIGMIVVLMLNNR